MYYFLVSLVFGLLAYLCVADFSNKWDFEDSTPGGIIAAILVFLLSWELMYWLQPPLSLGYADWLAFFIVFAIATAAAALANSEAFGIRFQLKSLIPLAIILFGLFFWFISSCSLFTSGTKQGMLNVKEVADEAYTRDMAQIQPESMILVDDSLAKKYAEATLEQDPATGSVCEVGKLSIQNLNGTFNVKLANGEKKTLTFQNEQVYVAPLEHSGFFKWKKNETTPGYIMVSAMKQNVVYFITEVNGEELRLKYLDSSYFSTYWKRYLRSNGFSNVKFADSNIELDDQGRPFMILPIRKNTVGYTCPEISSVAILDIQNGAIKEYSPKDVPLWVDRIYPSDLIEDRIEWWGEFQKGFWNSVFAQVGVRSQTPGIEQVYTNGNCYWYTGIQSGGADDGTSGFMLTNTRTGESKLYKISGVNEKASRKKISNYKIDAASIHPSRVLMYNIKNEPTYFATCKSESGEFMGYAFASVKYRDVCGVGKSVRTAYDDYCRALRSSRNGVKLDGEVVKDQKTFVVLDITKVDENYYLLFNERTSNEFVCPSDISWQLKWTQCGDSVLVSLDEGQSHEISLTSFKNVSLEKRLK